MMKGYNYVIVGLEITLLKIDRSVAGRQKIPTPLVKVEWQVLFFLKRMAHFCILHFCAINILLLSE